MLIRIESYIENEWMNEWMNEMKMNKWMKWKIYKTFWFMECLIIFLLEPSEVKDVVTNASWFKHTSYLWWLDSIWLEWCDEIQFTSGDQSGTTDFENLQSLWNGYFCAPLPWPCSMSHQPNRFHRGKYSVLLCKLPSDLHVHQTSTCHCHGHQSWRRNCCLCLWVL